MTQKTLKILFLRACISFNQSTQSQSHRIPHCIKLFYPIKHLLILFNGHEENWCNWLYLSNIMTLDRRRSGSWYRKDSSWGQRICLLILLSFFIKLRLPFFIFKLLFTLELSVICFYKKQSYYKITKLNIFMCTALKLVTIL